MWNGAGMDARGNESRDVRHVHKKERANRSCGFADALEIDDTRIGTRASDDHFWLVLGGELLDLVVVDAFVFLFHPISYELVHATGKIQRMPVRQVAAVGKIHSQDYVVFLESGHVNGYVGGCAGMRLHVGVFGAEEFLG